MSSTEQHQQKSEWMKAAYEVQAELADVEVMSVDEVLAEHQAQVDRMDDDFEPEEPDPIALMCDWLEELGDLAQEIPTQDNHYGWLVIDKVRNQLRDAYTEVRMYVSEKNGQ